MDDKKLPGTKPMTENNAGGYREMEPLANEQVLADQDGAATEPMQHEVPETVQHGPINSHGPAGIEENAKKTAIG